MNKDLNSETIFQKESRPGIGFFIPFVVAALVVGIVWILLSRKSSPEISPQIASRPGMTQNLNSSAKQEIILELLPASGTDWIEEKRTISGFESERTEIRMCIDNLLDAIAGKTNRLIEKEFKLDENYLDQQGTLYLDFAAADEYPNLGGASAESSVIQSILRTIRTNFPDMKAVKLLRNHHESDTFAGHIDAAELFVFPEVGVTDQE
jgi:hypothetical protein